MLSWKVETGCFPESVKHLGESKFLGNLDNLA
jgi:hypothetical protein